MKLANSTILAVALTSGFCLTAYVTAQQPGAAGGGPATSMPGNAGPGNAAQPQNTIGPITSATIGPTTSATIGPITSATIGPITSATIGPITGPSKGGTSTKPAPSPKQ